jgi:hypothetical protein
MLWHFDFRGPDEERLVQGRERIYLDRFWSELSADPKKIDEDARQHFAALYARPHAMHDAFEQFGALRQDAADNKALLAIGGKITMPVLALGAEKFFGKNMADHMRFVASNVTGGIVPDSGHWIMEENPQATIRLVTDFLAEVSAACSWDPGFHRWGAMKSAFLLLLQKSPYLTFDPINERNGDVTPTEGLLSKDVRFIRLVTSGLTTIRTELSRRFQS